MGRKKVKTEEIEEIEEDSSESPEKIRARITKEIEKTLGKGVIVRGSEIVERPRTIIPVSPRVDSIIGGGIPEGSWVVLSGKPKVGKTLTSLHFAKKCQDAAYGNRNIYYLNVEGRLKKRDIIGITNMDPDRLDVIESTEDRILTSQDFLTAAQKILLTDKRAVMIIDSVSQLCDEREMVGGIGTQTRGSGAILVGQFTSQLGTVVPVKNHIVICILHLRANTSGYGEAWMEKGGNAIQYQVDVKLRAHGDAKPWALAEKGDPFGQIVTWQCKSSAIGPPGRKCESYLRYGEGIDEIEESIQDAKDVGLITGDTYLTLDFLKNHLDEIGQKEWNDAVIKDIGAKLQGQHKLRKALVDHPEWLEIMMKDLKEAL